jgi:hypothetical protein
VLSNYPKFKWSSVDLADSYRVLITTKDGNVVFEGNTDKNTLTLSKPLQRGQVYNWQVGARFSKSDPWSNSLAARFKVLSSEDFASIQKVKSSLPGSHLALGAVYESLGFHNEAVNEYRALLKDNPTSSLALKLISND